MIPKEDLLKTVKTLWQDGRGFPIHKRHILQSMPWYGFTAEEEKTVQEILNLLARGAAYRAGVLEGLYKTISEKGKDVY